MMKRGLIALLVAVNALTFVSSSSNTAIDKVSGNNDFLMISEISVCQTKIVSFDIIINYDSMNQIDIISIELNRRVEVMYDYFRCYKKQ